MRAHSKDSLEQMSGQQIVHRLTTLNEVVDGESVNEMRKRLETTRHLMIWHDLSTVANHSHLVFIVTCLYDPACFYANSDYEHLTERNLNIQANVESPSVYIVAKSSSSDKSN